MRSRIRKVVLIAFAVLSLPLGPGCENTTNESGSEKVNAAPNPPKTQAEYYKQTQEQMKNTPKPSKSAR